jgi:hypothetical protein
VQHTDAEVSLCMFCRTFIETWIYGVWGSHGGDYGDCRYLIVHYQYLSGTYYLVFSPEGGGSSFLWNVLTFYTESYPRRI